MSTPRLVLTALLIASLVSPIVKQSAAQEVLLSAPARVIDETLQKRFPSSRLYWEGAQLESLDSRTLRLRFSPPEEFTSLAVAWSVNGESPAASAFLLSVSSRAVGGIWSSPVPVEGETAPNENPSGLYWSSLYMTPGGSSHHEFEIVMTLPSGVRLTMLQVMTAGILSLPSSRVVTPEVSDRAAGVAGVPRPTIIPRKDWWGDLPPDSLDAHFGPIKITISHAVVHHTAMTNNPPDPSQEIRSIWNLHVYGNGWSDIGYNFLIDQFGNIYQGRYNPWLDSTDVQGAHATSANVKSVGVSVLGNFGISAGGIPDPRALRSLEGLVAWRFDQRSLNPLDSASIPTNLGGPRVVGRICGHRDVGTTECPGENLYIVLPSVRLNVQTLLTGSAVNVGEAPHGFALHQNYPNPFNPSSTIGFDLPVRSHVTLTVFDILGQQLLQLINGEVEAGYHDVRLEGTNLSSGVYFYRLRAGDFVQTKRLLLVR
jgi:hypothetical protein